MRRSARWSAVAPLVGFACLVLVPASFSGQEAPSPLMPPQANAFGKSLAQWNVLQTQYAIAEGLGTGSSTGDMVGRVRLLPGEFFESTAEFPITVAPGTPLVAAPYFVFGERYLDPSVPDDDPVELAGLVKDIIDTAQVRIVLDGRVLVEGTGADLKRFQFGPTYFNEPIAYAEPQPRGPGLDAVAALWVAGIGAVFHPLPVGRHTLEYYYNTDFFGGFHITYHITVSPK